MDVGLVSALRGENQCATSTAWYIVDSLMKRIGCFLGALRPAYPRLPLHRPLFPSAYSQSSALLTLSVVDSVVFVALQHSHSKMASSDDASVLCLR